MDTTIIEQLKEAFAEEFSLVQHNLGEMEQFVMEKMQLLGAMVMTSVRVLRRVSANTWLPAS